MCVGQLLRGDDGYYAWWPEPSNGGYLDQGFLMAMATLLQELNAPWDAQVQRDVGQPKE
jgi:hypothetical protein